MSSTKAMDFMHRHGMTAEVDSVKYAKLMAEDMKRGLAGEKSSLPMIPTYIKFDGDIPKGKSVAVIDAGGTNFRCGLVTFNADGYDISEVTKRKMPGIDKPSTWEEFIDFVAESIMPLMDKTELIGFCFSYNADITPEIDGLVKRIDKEVIITGSSGKLVGASLTAALEAKGVHGKRVFILNDTVAALLGSSLSLIHI